jgi:hypothetical protein
MTLVETLKANVEKLINDIDEQYQKAKLKGDVAYTKVFQELNPYREDLQRYFDKLANKGREPISDEELENIISGTKEATERMKLIEAKTSATIRRSLGFLIVSLGLLYVGYRIFKKNGKG